jgi:bifunctional UDP-N-acetylglucosamine pyrophosphorylase/glucosamine-1-phosphate N-acetyltransferase
MHCVILVAGFGTRMGDLTKDCPKPMLSINKRPKLAYSIDMLPKQINDVVLVVGYLSEQIEKYFGNKFGDKNIYYVKQKDFNGTAGAVSLAKDIVRDRCLVLMGDDLYYKKDLEKLLDYEQGLLAFETNEAQQFGLVDLDSEGYLKSVIERPHNKINGLINTGAYVLSKDYFDMPMIAISNTEYGLPQTLVSMYPKNKTKIIVAQKWQSIGTPEDLEIAQSRINEFI